MKRFLLVTFLVSLYGLSFAEFPAVKVYEKTSINVVLIIAKNEGAGSMIGAGSIISAPGLISTNAHVVIDKATSKPYSQIRVFIKPDRVTGNFKNDLVNKHKAKILAYDLDLDLAILQAEDIPAGTGIIELADPDEIKIGEEAVAIGHPEQGGLWTLTYGRISGEIENQNSIEGKNVFQTDASVNRGNSGGPLLDKRGYMIGINSNMARLGAGDLPITGVNFAVKSSVLKNWLSAHSVMVAYGTSNLNGLEKAEKPAVVETDKKTVPSEAEKEKPSDKKVEPSVEKADKPVEAEVQVKPAEVEKADKPAEAEVQVKQADAEDKGKASGEKYQPHRNAYNRNDLLKAAEKELEDMMDEMRGKTRR
ncbi:MAG: trypsin-like peptidase domain-containing protein [Nitrospirae bacterium]|nr:trypsin-like peptidase domain-containing protein [Nitrospirota bacterium]